MTHDQPSIPPLIAIVGIFKFPPEDAPGRRVLALAKLIESSGARVVIGSGNPTPGGRPCEYPCDHYSLFHLSELPQRTTPRLLRAMREFLWGGRATSWLATLSPKPAAIILYGGYSPFSIWLLRFRHRTKIPIIVDAVEWYQPDHVPGGRFGPFRLNVEIALRWLFPKMKNIICISRYLQHHFEIERCHTLYLPAILDVGETVPSLKILPSESLLRLVYTGTPGKKDLLDPMIEALLRLDPNGIQIRFDIVGPSPEAILQLPALKQRNLTKIPPFLRVPGYVTSAQALTFVREADFSVLLRTCQRYAMAGFPTKVPESLAAGTPIICNLTSDLGDYIRDGIEGLICDHPTPESCKTALERALGLSDSQKAEMRQRARELADRAFDYNNYTLEFRSFIRSLINN